jgi:hypothetical protein
MNLEFHGPYYNLYNLGGAHGIYNASDDAKFHSELLDLVNGNTESDNFVCVTNGSQSIARERLNKIGFTTIKVSNLWVHTITRDQLLGRGASKKFQEEREAVIKLAEERAEERKKALAARPRSSEGRILRADGTVRRNAYEYFVGDRVRWRTYVGYETHRNSEWKTGTIRSVNADHTFRTLRNVVDPRKWDTQIELLQRAK